jgi:regulator of RNase E activity RraA
MEIFDEASRARLERLSTSNVSDALDALGLKGSTFGVRPIWHTMRKISGPAVTIKDDCSGSNSIEATFGHQCN